MSPSISLAKSGWTELARVNWLALPTPRCRQSGIISEARWGLHLAAAQHIADTIGARVRPLLVAARELRKSSDDAEVARLALRQILIGMLNVIVTEEFAADSRFVAREQANPGAAFEILFREVMEPMLDELSRLIACISGNQMSTQECRTRSVVLIGQVLVFRMAHATALRAAGWSSIDEGGVRLLRHVIDEHVVAICDRIEAAEPAQPKYIK